VQAPGSSAMSALAAAIHSVLVSRATRLTAAPKPRFSSLSISFAHGSPCDGVSGTVAGAVVDDGDMGAPGLHVGVQRVQAGAQQLASVPGDRRRSRRARSWGCGMIGLTPCGAFDERGHRPRLAARARSGSAGTTRSSWPGLVTPGMFDLRRHVGRYGLPSGSTGCGARRRHLGRLLGVRVRTARRRRGRRFGSRRRAVAGFSPATASCDVPDGPRGPGSRWRRRCTALV